MSQSVDPTENRQTEVLVVAWVMTGAAVLTVGIKLFARARIVHVIGWDDFFIFLSLIFSVIASSFVHYGVQLGFGQHTAVVAGKHGTQRLFQGAKVQMLGYPFNIDTTDPLWKPVPLVLWGLVEQNIVIIAACVPTMRPFFDRVWKRGLTSRSAPHSRSLAFDPFSSAAGGRDRLGRQDKSNSDLALVGAEVDMHTLNKAIDKDDAASGESQRGIVRTVEVRMDWNDKGM
ncbi:unnamed protein product [Alternaria sp. RS040]